VFSPRVKYQAPHVLLHWTVMISSGIWDSGFLASSLSLSFGVFSPKVKDQAPRILLHQMFMIYFRNLGFDSFRFSPLAFIQSVFSQSPPIATTCPSKSNGDSLLWDFGLREFQDFPSRFLPDYFPLELQIRHQVSSGSDDQYLLREFRLREF
jgi:hypothetical protein